VAGIGVGFTNFSNTHVCTEVLCLALASSVKETLTVGDIAPKMVTFVAASSVL
jgi:hypothetical protein